MPYIHPISGTVIVNYESREEHRFYENTTKREMFLLIKAMSELINPDQGWVQTAEDERETLKANKIK